MTSEAARAALDEAFEQGHAQGWTDAFGRIAGRLLEVLTTMEPVPRPSVTRCLECGSPMLIGQPARTIGRDISNRTLWAHVACPPAEQALPPENSEDQEQPMPPVYAAVATGQEGGPWTIIVQANDPSDTQLPPLLRMELDWDRWRPASAGHRLTEQGFRILPSLMTNAEHCAGWNKIDDYRWLTGVIRWETVPEPQKPQEQPPADLIVADTDSGSGYALPRRIPGRALEDVEPKITFISRDTDVQTATYHIENMSCVTCSGPLLMVMQYDDSGQFLRGKYVRCQASCEHLAVAV